MNRKGIALAALTLVLAAGLAPAAGGGLVVLAVTPTSIDLQCTAPGDDGITGTAAQYRLVRSTSPITAFNFDAAVVVPTPAPGPAGSLSLFTATGLTPGTTYYFAIKAADEVPNWSVMSNVVVQATLPPPDVTPPAPPVLAPR